MCIIFYITYILDIFLSFFDYKLNECLKFNFDQRCTVVSRIHILSLIIQMVVSHDVRKVVYDIQIQCNYRIQSDSFILP